AVRILNSLDQHVDAIAAPEQFTVEHHGGNAENPERFRFLDDAVVLGARRSVDIGLESLRRTADRSNHLRDSRKIVHLEIMTPEAAEYRLMIRTEDAMALRKQHADAGIEGIVDAPWSFHGEALGVGEAPRVHIGISHLAPEMRSALLDGSHEFGDA